MKILDFLFYYLVGLLEVTDRRKIKTTSYPDQAAYVIAICSILWLLLIDLIFDFIVFNTFESKTPNLIFIVVCLGLYFLYRHIYIKKGRYNLILGRSDPKFGVSDKIGRIIAVTVIFSSLLILMLTTIILHSLK